MSNVKTAPDLVLASEVARLFGVSVQTIRAWDRTNRLKPVMRTTSGVRLYARHDVEEMVEERRRDAAAPTPDEASIR